MNIQKKALRTVIFGCSILFWTHAAPIKAQVVGIRIPIRNIDVNTKPAVKSSPKRVVIQKVFVPVREVRTETKIVKTSNLTVSTEPGARVFLQPLVKNIKPIAPKTADRNRTVVFENLKPIKYKITASLEGFESQEQDVVEILPQKTFAMNLDLKPITYKLSFDTNIKNGEIRYAPAELLTNDSQGIKTKETGGYCIEPVKNGKAVIKELKKGYYNIDIRPGSDEVEFEPVLTAINVPNEILGESDDLNELQSYRIDLEKKFSTETFASAWTSSDWSLPTGWKLGKSMKTAGLPGVALPRNEQYRYYANFEMVSDVKSLDGKSVGFAVRARDEQNYYLIQISGKNADEPYVIKGYTVKNGVAEQFTSISIAPFKSTIAAQKSFRVIIKGEENIFKTFIEDSETADKLPLGDFIDRDNNFRKGAVGIVGGENSNFEVGSFTVCASSCR